MIALPRSRRRAPPLMLGSAARTAQRGAILIITLIVLVAMTLASIAMIRSVDTSTLIAGNLAFKQSATNSADAALTKAMDTLSLGGAEQDNPAEGYYATSQDNLDITGNRTSVQSDDVPWDDTSKVKVLPKDGAGNVVAYIVHRLCTNTGPIAGAGCSIDTVTGTGDDTNAPGTDSLGSAKQMQTYLGTGGGSATPGGSGSTLIAYYRITARVTGPKNNTSYVQAVVSR